MKCISFTVQLDLMSTEITVFGYSFKENCSDTRNTKVKNLILSMQDFGIKAQVWDPLISKKDHEELKKLGFKSFKEEPKNAKVAMICVYHNQFKQYFSNYDGIVFDYRNNLRV